MLAFLFFGVLCGCFFVLTHQTSPCFCRQSLRSCRPAISSFAGGLSRFLSIRGTTDFLEPFSLPLLALALAFLLPGGYRSIHFALCTQRLSSV